MSHIPISIELRFLRIPTRWSVSEEGYLMPEVDQRPQRKLTAILDDPRDLRTEFLNLPHKQDAALRFLNKIGLWSTWKARTLIRGQWELGTPIRGQRVEGAFGYRYFSHLAALPLELKELWRRQRYWKRVLQKNLTLLRDEFAALPRADASPAEQEAFAINSEFGNTLPIHLEWKSGPGQLPRAIIQPLTGVEFLKATAWLDVVQQAKVQICQRRDCGLPFTGREQKYCSDSCGHLMAVRAFRERQKQAPIRLKNERKAASRTPGAGELPPRTPRRSE